MLLNNTNRVLLLLLLLPALACRAQQATSGFPIPERFKNLLGRYDTNNNGVLSDGEIDAMPPALRDRIKGRLTTKPGATQPNPASPTGPVAVLPTGKVRAPDAAALERTAKYVAATGGQAFLVMVDGKIISEKYSNGGSATRIQGLASGSKSFNGVVAACAVQDGLMTWDEKAADTLTEWKGDARKSRITLRQLLHQTDGIQAGETGAAGRALWKNALAAPATDEPGARFVYGPYHFLNFGNVMERKLKAKNPTDTYAAYLKRRILDPLGIKVTWGPTEDGQPQLAGGASMTARDWATFGEFMRNGGIHNGKQIVAEKNLAELIMGDDKNPAYGLSWWLKNPVSPALRRSIPILTRDMGDLADSLWVPKDMYLAAGAGKQMLYIIPSLKLVAVRMGPIALGRVGFHDLEFLANLLREEK